MNWNGLTTGNTLTDLGILVLIPLLTLLAQRFGLTAFLVRLGEALAKIKPEAEPEPIKPMLAIPPRVETVNPPGVYLAADPARASPMWLLLLMPLLEILIKRALELLERRLGRKPTAEESAEEISRVSRRFRAGKLKLQLIDQIEPEVTNDVPGDAQGPTG